MDLQLRDRVAFVPASSKGLGRAIAEAFVAEGADVAMCARDPATLAKSAEVVAGSGRRVWTRAVDVSNGDEIAAAIAAATEDFGRLDCLVINAGGPPLGNYAAVGEEAWREAFELTLMSAVNMVGAALPALRRSDSASIVFVSSTSLKQPIPGLLLSNSIRLAVAGFAKNLANELAPGIRVNTLMPGRILTDRTLARAGSHPGGQAAFIADEARTIPLGRFGTPEEFARVVVFLASPAASYVTGSSLAVDGGLIQTPV